MILDDYSVSPPCQLALRTFFETRDEHLPELEAIDRVGVCFQKH